MMILSASDFNVYVWIIIPLLIFIARVIDVSIGTVRLIFISRGLKYLAPVVGFIEVLIWIIAISQIMKNLSNPICYVAYAGGFATGNFIGMWIAEKLSLGVVLIRVITQKDATELLQNLKMADYGVTIIDGQGSSSQVKVIFTIVSRREVRNITNLIKEFNPRAFYTVEEVGFVEKGIFPPKQSGGPSDLFSIFRPFRKGK